MKIIVDSGSTKADWVFLHTDGREQRQQTRGINPVHQSDEEIVNILSELSGELHPTAVFFYGAGILPELQEKMRRLLMAHFPTAQQVDVESDLVGAARALCVHKEGVACILGTGSNSCLYDGKCVVANTPPLGYVLGDEGSGAVLGKLFLNALYKGMLPASVVHAFEQEWGLSQSDVIQRVYREPMPNRFMASLALFIRQYGEVPEMRLLIIDNFRQFFRRNIAPYGRTDLPVSFVGSIAFFFRHELTLAAQKEGYALGCIERSPLRGLVAYHGHK